MAKHIVCLSFDYDVTSWHMPDEDAELASVTEIEDGHVGAKNILKVLEKQEIPATWFISGFTIQMFPEICDAVILAGHEVGHSGWTHVAPAKLSRKKEEDLLIRANATIQKLSGQKALGYRSPAWDHSPLTLDLLLKYDFLYESSMMGTGYDPYRVRRGYVEDGIKMQKEGHDTRLIEIPINWSQDDHTKVALPLLEPEPGQQSGVVDSWLDEFLYMQATSTWGIITYTCHPYVIGRSNRAEILARFVAQLKTRGATFMTMEDAAREYNARAPFAARSDLSKAS